MELHGDIRRGLVEPRIHCADMTTMSQSELPFLKGRERKRAGQNKAVDHLSVAYRYDFKRALDHFILWQQTFTIDDIVAVIGLPSEGKNRNNALGALISMAAKEGLIRKAGFTTSRRPESHNRIIHQWMGVKHGDD